MVENWEVRMETKDTSIQTKLNKLQNWSKVTIKYQEIKK